MKPYLILFIITCFKFNAQLEQIKQNWANDKDLKNASFGFSVLNARTSETLAEYNAHLALVPASTLKIATTSAALYLLGVNYRYETKIYYTGTLDKSSGLLKGDLIIVGSGDPSLQSEYFTKDNALITDKWAKAIKDKGILEISGTIVADASCFERTVPANWIWEDISNYFGASPCGLSFMDNKFKLIYTSKEKGSMASLNACAPNYINSTYSIQTHVISQGNEDEAYVYGDPFSFSRTVSGSIPPNKTNYEVEAALPDPALLCAENLFSSLKALGIKCVGTNIRSVYSKEQNEGTKQLLYTHYSPTLDKLVFHTNVKSNNHYCESILLTLGKGSREAGLLAVKNFWQNRGLNTDELFMKDASGLSRINTMTCNFQAALLQSIAKDSSMYRVFSTSLPMAGKQGSMSNIGKGKFIENNMRAKTGYITRVRAYCGYVSTRSGKDLSFSVILNNYNCSPKEAKLKLETFLIALGEL